MNPPTGEAPSAGEPGEEGGDDHRLQVISASHGPYPEVSRLNPEFLPGVARLKLTVRIGPADGLPTAEALLASLEGDFPSLNSHRCCGANSLRDSFFRRRSRPRCAVEGPDAGVDLAHLVEHLIIDIQHYVGRMRICSGITCAYREPRDLYDIFVECPEEKVGLLSASVAVGLVDDLLARRPFDPHYRRVMDLARLARDAADHPIHTLTPELEESWGPEAVSEAIGYLRVQGYLSETRANLNFSGEPILTFRVSSDS